ncbi:NADase-type glycan-binding domain-containing protein [Treponema bryantii]|uniref:NADase-type glycan-binding domain-containing protein n=1 Tax=Treponema bryantii TaxID=163 RepID=UPI0003B3799B|nr:hypothetical protein [Treponema bryantii]
MKKKIFNVIFLVVGSLLYGQNYTLNGEYRFTVYSGLARIDIADKNIMYVPLDDDKENVQDIFKITHISQMPFIQLNNSFPKEYTKDYIYNEKNDLITDNKILFLSGKTKINGYDNIILLTTTKGFDKESSCTESLISEKVQIYKDCSSYLKEKNVDYPVTNLCELAIDSPWVEAVQGDGKGEGFTLVNSWGVIYSYILLMNGYISYNKPYLYKQNNRIKKIKVTGLKSGKSQILDVLDTPHPQTVDISFITEAEDVRVEIADVYKGTKYDDTCLHYCITFNEPVIPYEDSIEK